MALMTCNECGEKVSNKAGACPHCGAPIKLDEIYSDEEREIVTVKVSNIFVTALCAYTFFIGVYLSWLIFTTTSARTYSIIPFIICLLIALFEMYILKKSYITLTNKRVTGIIDYFFSKDEVDYPLRQIKRISSFGIFGISNFKISIGYQEFRIRFAVNGKKFKKEYFNLIENKYKYN